MPDSQDNCPERDYEKPHLPGPWLYSHSLMAQFRYCRFCGERLAWLTDEARRLAAEAAVRKWEESS